MITLPFVYNTALVASLSSANTNPANMSNLTAVPLPWPSVLRGASLMTSASVTAGTITFSLIKNSATSITFPNLSTSFPLRRTYQFTSSDVPDANHLFAADDRISVQISTSATLAPTGGFAGIVLYFTPYWKGV